MRNLFRTLLLLTQTVKFSTSVFVGTYGETNQPISLSQDKPLFNLQQKIASVYTPLCWIYIALGMEKESMEDSCKNLNKDHLLAEISQLLSNLMKF